MDKQEKTSEKQLQIIARKIDQLDRLASIKTFKEASLMPASSNNDILILMRYGMSLEKQIRQLQLDTDQLMRHLKLKREAKVI